MTTTKRPFKILDEMNQDDTKNRTRLVAVSNHFISGQKIKEGATIMMGVPEGTLLNLLSETHMALLVVIEKEEYFKRMNS